MRLLPIVLLVGCGSTTSTPAGPVNDAGTDAPIGESNCFSDGWCLESVSTGLPSDVWASGPDDVWVLGQDRTLLRFDGNTWSKSTLPGDGQGNAVLGRAKNDVWASVGERVMHFDGTSWTDEAMSPPSVIIRFAIDESGQLWGRTGWSGVYRREGTTWVAKIPDKTVDLGGASIVSCDGKVWLAAGLMAEWDGTTFWQHGVSGDDDAVRAAGTYGAGQAWVSTRLLRRYGSGTFRANLREGAPRGIATMSVGEGNTAWAIAEGEVLASYDGTKWKTHTIDMKDVIDVGYVSPTVVHLMKKNGVIIEWDSATSTQKTIASAAGFTIVGPYASSFFKSGGEAYYNENGRSWRWQAGSEDWTSTGSTANDVRRIWAASSTSIWATGGTTLERSNGTSMNAVATGIALQAGETYLDVGGSGESDVWVITSLRNLHYDGSAWKVFASGFLDPDTKARVVSLGPSDAWVFRSRARFAHFDGTSFRAEPQLPTIDWAGCAGSGEMLSVSQNPTKILRGPPLAMKFASETFPEFLANDVWFGTGTAWLLGNDISKHQITFFDGTTLRVSAETTGRPLNSIWALPSGEAWAVGNGGVLHRKP